ncbi:DNA-directed RNA polymerase subunit beta' [Candidatus Berkelbacteria bacterium CG_4_9_14_0_2_um_filter_42_30]|uniref:DNA-directed RNA polymerase subunit beta' n=5 Tax=Candidatus Berkelbacteria TaxID=1618330 RepID=A0A2M7K264_9BACT|nr:MAG: DNA-directed RNA polymerase subunit beta' [Candidatus Berkelbacteria bacterium CG1_02_42_45]PIP50697.1 MAG: DNA-directed RNA polymerase subunit beta' [Candidatus Berkelbacteria bacterium CG23_combo_of_CG06-09_8_20_14_all_41_73]PIR27231.1 MAG: DNA-directed RNA polymerase subunit beta' [Candidatus Berkelbacteria bacterium CG11_big_fil_rev_8_21_14_0_20_42_15]PIX30343.1 MAG: DNA-directed RNA polymerase subunit beta' [Candidatus Berkelbacteria bacterium CG_4_8_14_3_um_filter_42_13]PJC65657.1
MPKVEVKDAVNVIDFSSIRISVASPDDILSWSHGEVLKPETINYRTQKPERDGLFGENIFGPTKDWECYCGKYRKVRYSGVVCDKCGVEVTKSNVRRVRMGHIDLVVPIAHIWYVRSVPCILGQILDLSSSDLEKVIYFASFIIVEVNEELRAEVLERIEKEFADLKEEKISSSDPTVSAASKQITTDEINQAYKTAKLELESLQVGKIISERDYHNLSHRYGNVVRVGIGAEAILELLEKINLEVEIKKIEAETEKAIGLSRRKLFKRLRVLQGLSAAQIKPDWLILRRLPVIPPDLRPMVQLDGGRFAASDLNDLYRRVINRNNRLKRLISQGAPEVICRNEKRMLQEAVDALIDNSARRGRATTTANNRRKLKSLSDMLRGKQGRFRQNLLGKRVDYSGRSVIVVGPELKLHQCGLPKVMAMELFKPFVIGRLISEGYVHNVKNATRLIEKNEPFVWDILEGITRDSYVLLNRAPTLHRLGIQAFQPVLIEGKAIKIHPLVCPAFNADFDGDQMAVHLPLSADAQKEAGEIMLSRKNLLKPSSGEPVISPTLDMILGCYFLTTISSGRKGEGKFFTSKEEAMLAYDLKVVDLKAKIKVQVENLPALPSAKLMQAGLPANAPARSASGTANAGGSHKAMQASEIIETSVGRIIFSDIIPPELGFRNQDFDKHEIAKLISESFKIIGLDRTTSFVDSIKEIGFQYAQQSGITFSAFDIQVPPQKEIILKNAESQLEIVTQQYRRGLVTNEERYTKTVEIWMNVAGELQEAMLENFDQENDINIIRVSGAQGKVSQLNQLAGMKGLVADPTGNIIELPIKSNFKEGLSVFEYFVSSHGSRKGRADTALRTSEAGYLTRRLVDVSQDTVVTTSDCGVSKGIIVSKALYQSIGEDWAKHLIGRTLNRDIAGFKRNTLINAEVLEKILATSAEEVEIRSLLTCEQDWGVCQHCYGEDLATGRLVEIGSAIGIVAAQAIGEPGTQLTMRTFHTGGAAGEDITSGLPRVGELFEARTPRNIAVMSEIEGKASIRKEKNKLIITIVGKGEMENEHHLSGEWKVVVKNGEMVKSKQILATPKDGETKPIRAKVAGAVKIEGDIIKIISRGKTSREYVVSEMVGLRISDGDEVKKGQVLTEGHLDLQRSYELAGRDFTERYIITEVQKIYASQGQEINDKHLEVIVRQMNSKCRIVDPGSTEYLDGSIHNRIKIARDNKKLKASGKKEIQAEDIVMGITRVALKTDSFLSAASFMETTSILINAAITGAKDNLRGLKENVIIGRKIPAGTGFKSES